MATAGPSFPTIGENVASGIANAVPWTTPGGITASGGTLAQCIAATFDSPDPTDMLVARGFGFSIPADATIDGVTVVVNRRSIISGSGKDLYVYLYMSPTGQFGNDKASATTWPTTLTSATYGGASDNWGAGLTPTMVNSANFGVSVIANALIANADIEVDYITLRIDYTPVAGINYTQPVADTLSLADSATPQSGKSADIADTLTLADSAPTFQAAFSRTVPDTLTLADSLASTRTYEWALPEALSVADALRFDRALTLADTLALADSASTQAGKSVSIPDTLTLGDSLSSSAVLQRAVADSLTVADSFASEAAFLRAVADTLALADLVDPVKTAGGVAHSQPVDDTLSVADALRFDRGLTAADGVALSDLLAAAEANALSLSDDLALADSFASTAALLRSIADTLSVADSLTTSGAGAQAIADTLALADSLSSQAAFLRSAADTLSLADALALDRTLTLADTLALADLCSPVKTAGGVDHTQPVADTLTLADSLVSQAVLLRTQADTLALEDATATQAAFLRSVADTLSLADVVITAAETITEGYPGDFDPDTERGRVSASQRSDEYGLVPSGRSRSRSTAGTFTSVQSGKIGVS